MTTTAFDDQFTTAPEPVRQPYDTAAILRRNVADLELALKQQTERAEAAEAAEAELKKAKPGHPIAWAALPFLDALSDGRRKEITVSGVETGWKTIPLYAAPVPAPAVPAVTATCNDGLQVELIKILSWMISQRGKNAHRHRHPGTWDDGELAGRPCEQCAMYDKARALLQSAEVRHV